MKNNEIRKPIQQRAIETKKQLMDAGIKLFSDNGYYKTNTKQIAKEAGVAIGSFYAYFKDKHDLFLAILHFYFYDQTDELFEQAKILLESINQENEMSGVYLKEKIKIIIESLLQLHNKISTGFHREIEIMEYSDPEVRKIKQQHSKRELKMAYNLLKMFEAKIKRKDIALSSMIMLRVIDDIAHYITYENTGYERGKIINEISVLLYNYLFN